MSVEFEAGFSMGVAAAQREVAVSGNEELVRRALDLEAAYLEDLGEHAEAQRVRARIPRSAGEGI